MENERYIKDFILDEFDTTEEEIYQALVYSTTIVYQDNMVCLMDKSFVFYFGTTKKQQKTKKFYQFYKQFDLKGKEFVSKDIKMYYKRVENGIIV